jgi:hypothetical protein
MALSKVPLALVLTQIFGASCKDSNSESNVRPATVQEGPYVQCLLKEAEWDTACTTTTRERTQCSEIACKPNDSGVCESSSYIKVTAAVPASHDQCYPGVPTEL